VREDGRDRLLAAVNFAPAPAPLALARPGELPAAGALVLSTDPDRDHGVDVRLDALELRGGEGVLVAL
jgi:hypothetical protein